jgi:hypothetical protein
LIFPIERLTYLKILFLLCLDYHQQKLHEQSQKNDFYFYKLYKLYYNHKDKKSTNNPAIISPETISPTDKILKKQQVSQIVSKSARVAAAKEKAKQKRIQIAAAKAAIQAAAKASADALAEQIKAEGLANVFSLDMPKYFSFKRLRHK